MLQVFIIAALLMAFAFVGLGVNIFFANKPFPETEVGKNKKMREKGIECAKCSEWRKFNERKRFTGAKIDFSKLSVK